jgi:hypothetical protein
MSSPRGDLEALISWIPSEHSSLAYLVSTGVLTVLLVFRLVAEWSTPRVDIDKFVHYEADYKFPLGIPLKSNPIVFMDIAIADQYIGRIIIELKPGAVPKAAQNFLALCKGFNGHGFKQSSLHRLCDFACYGGDFENGNGTGGHSVYPDGDFPGSHCKKLV